MLLLPSPFGSRLAIRSRDIPSSLSSLSGGCVSAPRGADRYWTTWMRSIRIGTLTWHSAARFWTVSIWWQLPSMTASQGRACSGSRRCASAKASAMTSAAGLRTDANSVFPSASGPGRRPGGVLAAGSAPGRTGLPGCPPRCGGRAGCRRRRPARPVRLRRLSAGQPGHRASRLASAASARATAALAVAGRSAAGSTVNADPSQVSSTARSAAGHGSGRRDGVERLEIGRRAERVSSACRLPSRDRALRADLGARPAQHGTIAAALRGPASPRPAE